MHVVKVGFVCPLRTPLRLNCIAAATSTDWSKTSVLFRVLTLKKSRWNLSQALKKQLRSTVLAVSHLFIGQKVDKASAGRLSNEDEETSSSLSKKSNASLFPSGRPPLHGQLADNVPLGS